MSFLSFSHPVVTLLMVFFISFSMAAGLKYRHAGMWLSRAFSHKSLKSDHWKKNTHTHKTNFESDFSAPKIVVEESHHADRRQTWPSSDPHFFIIAIRWRRLVPWL